MLKIFDKNHNPIGYIRKYKDLCIESVLDPADKTLSFMYLAQTHEIDHEYYIQNKTDEYVVKEIKESTDGFPVFTAILNTEELDGKAWESFSAKDATPEEIANLALTGTGWAVDECEITKKRSMGLTKCNSRTILEKICLVFMCEMSINSKEKKISFYEKLGEDKGVYFTRELNLVKMDLSSDTLEYYTRIIPIGKDGLKITEVNGGKEYLENYQYSNKVLARIWEDTNYEDATALMEDAAARLEDMSKPRKSYYGIVRDLAKQNQLYGILSYALGDTITLIDHPTGIRDKQRIVKLREYPQNPNKNTFEIANTRLTAEEEQQKLREAASIIEAVTNTDGSLNGSSVDKITIGQILGFEENVNESVENSASFVTIKNDVVNIAGELIVVKETVGSLDATYLKVTEADIKYATIEKAELIEASVHSLTGDYADFKTITTEEFASTSANIEKLTGDFTSFTTGEFNNLKSQTAELQSAIIGKANITDLEAIRASIENLDSTYASIEYLTANYATVNELNALKGNIENLDATYAKITDLQAVSTKTATLEAQYADISTLLSGNVSSGSIQSIVLNSSNATIANGTIKSAMIESLTFDKITGFDINTTNLTIHSNDGKSKWSDNTIQISDANRVRVQIGKDASNDYSMSVWDAEGKLIWDALGATENTIQRKIIRNDVVADDAAIAGSKLDINSVVRSLNGATETLSSTSVIFDDINQTFNASFKSMETTVANNLEQAKAYVDGEIDGLEIGGRNLLLDTDKYLIKNDNTATNYNLYFSLVNTDISQWAGKTVTLSVEYEHDDLTWAGVDNRFRIGVEFYITRSSGTYNYFGIWKTVYDPTSESVITADKGVLTKTFTLPSSDIISIGSVGVHIQRCCGYVKIGRPKLERGTKATDWTPAPEDTEGAIDELTTVTQTHSTNISVMQGQIETLIAKDTEIENALGDKVTTSQYNSIKATVDSHTQTIGSHTTQLNTQSGQISSVSSRVTTVEQNLDTWSAKLTSTQSELTALTSRVSTAETSITALRGEIALKVSQTEVDAAIDGIEIGGRNLLKYSADGYITTGSDNANSYITKATGKITINTACSGNAYCWINSYFSTPVTGLFSNIGDVFTFSIDIKVTGYVDQVKCSIDNRTSSHAMNIVMNTNNIHVGVDYTEGQWIRLTGQGTVNNSGDTFNRSLFAFNWVNATAGTIIEYRNLKVEKGTKATDWTPAPEDVDSAIDTVDAKFANYSTTIQMNSAIELSKSSILSTVSSTYTTKAELNTVSGKVTSLETWKTEASQKITKDGIIATVGNYYAYETDLQKAESRLTTAETEISQQANTITLLATKEELTSAIQVKADSILTTVGNNYATKSALDSTNSKVLGMNSVVVDASSYDESLWIPFVGNAIVPKKSYSTILVSNSLDSKTVPSWSTHSSGFTVDFEIRDKADGWGTSAKYEPIIIQDSFSHCLSSPVSYAQATYGSTPVLYLRGGGKYRVYNNMGITAWTGYPNGYTWTSGSYSQSFPTSTSRPSPRGGKSLGAVQTIAVQTQEQFKWVVASGTSASDFTITDRMATLTADYINLNGLVTFNGLGSDAQSKINTAQTTANTANSTANAVNTTVTNNKTYWDSAYNWVITNGNNTINLNAMVKKWTNNAVSTSTYIQGGWIATNTITADKIAADQILSQKLTATNLTVTGDSVFEGVLNGATGVFKGTLTIEDTAGHRTIIDSSGNIRMSDSNTDSSTSTVLTIEKNDGRYIQLSPWFIHCYDSNANRTVIGYTGVSVQNSNSTIYTSVAQNSITVHENGSETFIRPTYIQTGTVYEGGTALSSKYQAKGSYAAASHEHNYLAIKGTNTISSVANDTTNGWGSQSNGVHWYRQAGLITSQPATYGFLFNIGFGSEVHQMWFTQAGGSVYHRGGNGSGWASTWKEMLDSTNYTNYCAKASHTHSYLPLSGGNLTGALVFNNNVQLQWKNTSGTAYQVAVMNSSNRIAFGNSNLGVIIRGSTITSNKTITVSSDRAAKHDIADISQNMLDAFMDLRFVQFRYNEDNEKLNAGLVYQEAKETFEKHGIYDFAGIQKPFKSITECTEEDIENGAHYGSIAYDQFQNIHMAVTQKHHAYITELQNGVVALNLTADRLEGSVVALNLSMTNAEQSIEQLKHQYLSQEERLTYVTQQLEQVLTRESHLITENSMLREEINNLKMQMAQG